MEICCKNVNVVFVQHLLTLSGQGRIIDFIELMNKEKNGNKRSVSEKSLARV